MDRIWTEQQQKYNQAQAKKSQYNLVTFPTSVFVFFFSQAVLMDVYQSVIFKEPFCSSNSFEFQLADMNKIKNWSSD